MKKTIKYKFEIGDRVWVSGYDGRYDSVPVLGIITGIEAQENYLNGPWVIFYHLKQAKCRQNGGSSIGYDLIQERGGRRTYRIPAYHTVCIADAVFRTKKECIKFREEELPF